MTSPQMSSANGGALHWRLKLRAYLRRRCGLQSCTFRIASSSVGRSHPSKRCAIASPRRTGRAGAQSGLKPTTPLGNSNTTVEPSSDDIEISAETLDALVDHIDTLWGTDAQVAINVPSHVGDERFAQWYASAKPPYD